MSVFVARRRSRVREVLQSGSHAWSSVSIWWVKTGTRGNLAPTSRAFPSTRSTINARMCTYYFHVLIYSPGITSNSESSTAKPYPSPKESTTNQHQPSNVLHRTSIETKKASDPIMSQPLLTPGRALITLANLLYAVGAFAADFNETHVYNPRWPPHARFHNGQTMTLGVFLSAMSLYFAYRRPTGSSSASGSPGVAAARESMFYSALIGSFYCAAGLTAILYPG